MKLPIPFEKSPYKGLGLCLAFVALGGSLMYASLSFVEPAEEQAPLSPPCAFTITCPPLSSSMAEVDIPSADIPIGTGMDIDLGLGAGLGKDDEATAAPSRDEENAHE